MAPEASARRDEPVSLARVVWHVQQHYGAGWYYAPGRWRTSDGYAPFPVVVHAYMASAGHAAALRLSLMRAIMLAQGDPKRTAEHIRKDEALARG